MTAPGRAPIYDRCARGLVLPRLLENLAGLLVHVGGRGTHLVGNHVVGRLGLLPDIEVEPGKPVVRGGDAPGEAGCQGGHDDEAGELAERLHGGEDPRKTNHDGGRLEAPIIFNSST